MGLIYVDYIIVLHISEEQEFTGARFRAHV